MDQAASIVNTDIGLVSSGAGTIRVKHKFFSYIKAQQDIPNCYTNFPTNR